MNQEIRLAALNVALKFNPSTVIQLINESTAIEKYITGISAANKVDVNSAKLTPPVHTDVEHG